MVASLIMDVRVAALVALASVVLMLVYRVWAKLYGEPRATMAFYAAQGVPGDGYTPVLGDMVKFIRIRNAPDPFAASLEYWAAKARGTGVWYQFSGPVFQLQLTDPDWIQEVRTRCRVR